MPPRDPAIGRLQAANRQKCNNRGNASNRGFCADVVPLPQSVYDAISNPAVGSYTVPYGTYTVPSDLLIQKSNFTLDFNGSTLVYTPDSTSLIEVSSVINSFVDPSSPTRNTSHLTGTITSATTTLTMDPAEIVSLSPGEVVTIVAGVNTSDPLEPFKFIVATVQSVSGQVITFTAPLGVDVTVWASEAALKAAIDSSLWPKVGPWGVDFNGANYKKGLGTDHGLLRYIGGMKHDITIKNFHLNITIPADMSIPVSSGQSFFCRDILNLTISNFSLQNIVTAPIHTWRCNNVLVDSFQLRGISRTAIFNPGTTLSGWMMTDWGGSNITYQNGDVDCNNIMFANTETSPSDVLFRNINFTSTVAQDWSYAGQAVLMGFYGQTLGTGVHIEDSTLNIIGSNSAWDFDPGNSITFKNLIIPSITFPDVFDFTRHTIEGTLSLGGISYGPSSSSSVSKDRSGPSNSYIHFPKGFYSFARFRVTQKGSATSLYDSFGNVYDAALDSGAWTLLATNSWCQLIGGQSIVDYFSKQRLYFNFSGSTHCLLDFEIIYLPAPDDIGWILS